MNDSGSRRSAKKRALGWRLATPVALVGAGVLFVTSAVSSGGTDLRPGQYGDLADLAREETDRVETMQAQVAALHKEIDELSGQLEDGSTKELQKQIDALAVPAGMTAMDGPGLTVTLDDAPREIQDSASQEQQRETIVHQQDIQAVVNALWAGGAEAVTIQGQRVISTTGIKCVGNTVLLHGVTYSPPYVISAIGGPEGMKTSLDDSLYVQAYLADVEQWQLGWDVDVEDSLKMPAYTGTESLQYARPAGLPSADSGT